MINRSPRSSPLSSPVSLSGGVGGKGDGISLYLNGLHGYKQLKNVFFKRSKQDVAMILLIIVQLCFSVFAVFGASALELAPSVTPLAFTAGRQIIAVWTLIPIALIVEGRVNPKTSDYGRIVIVGILGGVFVPDFYLIGLQLTDPTSASLFDGPIIPLTCYTLAVLIGVERLPKTCKARMLTIGFLLMAAFGAIIILLGGGKSKSLKENDTTQGMSSKLLGWTLLFGESLSVAISLIVSKDLCTRYPPVTFSLWCTIIGMIVNCMIVTFTTNDGAIMQTIELVNACSLSWRYMGALFYVSMMNTVFVLVVSSFANSILPSSTVSLMSCLQPAITLILQYMVRSTPIRLTQMFGVMILGNGMLLHTRHAASLKELGVK